MNTIANNIIREIKETKREFLTKDEIIEIINRTCGENTLPLVESNGVVINPQNHTLTINGTNVNVPKKVYDLIYYFITNKNKMLTRDKILNDVWGTDVCVVDRTVDVHIRKVRQLLPENFIKTNKNFGYIWQEK